MITVDYSSLGVGYALYDDHPDKGRLVAVNSKVISELSILESKKGDAVSSYLGEFKGLLWALQSIKIISILNLRNHEKSSSNRNSRNSS